MTTKVRLEPAPITTLNNNASLRNTTFRDDRLRAQPDVVHTPAPGARAHQCQCRSREVALTKVASRQARRNRWKHVAPGNQLNDALDPPIGHWRAFGAL